MSKQISLQKTLVKIAVLSSVAAGIIAFILLVGISIYQNLQVQDDIMDEIADALIAPEHQPDLKSQISQLSEEFDLQYQLRQQQRIILQSEHFEIDDHQLAFAAGDEHFGYVWSHQQPWRSYKSIHPDTGMQVMVYQPLKVRFEEVLASFVLYAALLLGLWLLQWLFASLAIKRKFQVIQTLSQNISAKSAQDLSPILQPEPGLTELQPIILQLNHLLQHLQQSLEAEQRFTADASHELRSPLSAIQLRLQLLQRKYRDQPQFTQELQHIQQDVSRGTQVVENLLLLARLDPTETADLQSAHIDLSALLAEVWQSLEIFSLEKQVQLHTQLQVSWIKANPELLATCLRNLLDNAIRYSPPQGRIDLKIYATAQKVFCTIENEGEGLTESMIAHLGERFYRVLGTKTMGSGLGLSICKKIMQLHQAELHFSASEHGGLKVELVFQAAAVA